MKAVAKKTGPLGQVLLSCFGGPGGTGARSLPAALHRGGLWRDGEDAGVFNVDATGDPSGSSEVFGFRCAR